VSTPGNGKAKWSDIIDGCVDDLPLAKLSKMPKICGYDLTSKMGLLWGGPESFFV
jgi:hypothetical protein